MLDETLTWLDPHWDPDVGLLRNPPGSFDDLAPPGSLHLVPQSVWYATGCLLRGDVDRATRTIEAVCDVQYDAPGTPWHGTFARFAEWPEPRDGAVEWVDYDPNWRQFVGCGFGLLLRTADLPEATERRMREAVELACAGEPPDRAGAWYTNIALMRAWVEAHHGDRDRADALRREIVERFDAHDAFDEYNSPTYLGLDLYALALWRAHPASEGMRSDGERLEAAHWRDLARWYHPGLGNLCGPYSRAYGMDATRTATLVGLWLWSHLGERTAFPPLEGRIDHGHDVAFASCVAALPPQVPDDVDLQTFAGERTVTQDLPMGRRATGWLSSDVMLGGESGGLWPAHGQYHPATLHWRAPDGVGWIRVRHSGPLNATTGAGRLAIELPDPGETTVVCSHPPDVDGDRWTLPGLDLTVETDAEQHVEAGRDGAASKVRFGGATRLELIVR